MKHNHLPRGLRNFICEALAFLTVVACIPAAAAAEVGGLTLGSSTVSLEEVGASYIKMDEGTYQIYTFNLNTVVNVQYAKGVGADIVTDTPSGELNEDWYLQNQTGYYFTLSPLHVTGCFLTSQGYDKGLTLSRFVSDDSLWRAIRNDDGSITLQCKNGYVMDTTCGRIDQVGTRILSYASNGFVQAQHYWFSRISESRTLTPPTRVNAFNKTCAIMVDANANKCVNIQYGAKKGGLAVVDTFNYELHEGFNIVARANNLVSIHPLHATEYALSCDNPIPGQQVQLKKYTGSDEDLWEVYQFSDGTYAFRGYKTKLFHDNYCCNITDGTKIITHSYNGSSAQRHTLKDFAAPSAPASTGYAAYNGVNYRSLTSNARRIAACDKAVRMATALWTTPCSFPTWKSSGGTYNTVTATDGTSSRQFLAGKTYQGIPYSMAGRTYDDTKWLQLVQSGLTTSLMTGKYYTSKADTTAKGIDCSYLVCTALNAGCGTSINLNTAGMLSSSKFQKISLSQMLPGDIFLKSGHVMFFLGKTGGKYAVIEANASYSRVVYRELSASGVSGYGCYRYTGF